MYLSKLRIKGFKSFPEPSEIEFQGGITAIVGPNGCGKTNIVDSIRWVLGEQKVSLLRGERMEEVIFNGTSELKPLGMAEVTLEIINSKGILPVEYDTVSLTRRLYRSGESEYLINKRQCRLKDIVGLIADTGMGPHTYSVIQQNMIDSILSDKTDDRRFLFEEAAGITGYKIRRKETLRKLDTVGADLIRINDIASEVEKQVRSLNRQYRKAERYKRLSDGLKEIELKLFAFDYRQLNDKLTESKTKKTGISDRISALKSESSKLMVEIEERKEGYSHLREKLNRLSAELSPIEKELLEDEKQLASDDQRLKYLNETIEKTSVQLEDLEKRLDELEAKRDDIKSKIEENKKLTKEAAVLYNNLDKELLDAENKVESQRGIIGPSRDKLEELGNRLASLNAGYGGLISRRDEYQNKIKELHIRKDDIAERISKTEMAKETSETERVDILSAVESLNTQKADLEKRLSTVSGKLRRLQEETQRSENAKSSIEAKLETLSELKSSYEGFSEGAKALLSEGGGITGLKGAVIDSLAIPRELVSAAEVSLGRDADLIIVSSIGDALDAIDYLQEQRKGSAGFALENKVYGDLIPIPEGISSLGGYKGRLSDFISDERGGYLSKLLFGNVILMDNREDAVESLSMLPSGLSVVTKKGEYFKTAGILRGGISEAESSIVGRHTAISLLETEMKRTDETISKLKEEASTLIAEEMNIKVLIQDINDNIAQSNIRLNKIERKLASLNMDNSHLGENLHSLDADIRGLNDKLVEVEEKIKSEIQLKTDIEKSYRELKKELETKSDILKKSESELRELTRRANSAKVNIINLESEGNRLESELNTNSDLISRVKRNIDNYRRELEDAHSEIKALEVKRVELIEKIGNNNRRKDEFINRMDSLKGDMAEYEESIRVLENKLSRLRIQQGEFIQKENELSVAIAETETEIKHLRQKSVEEYGVDVDVLEFPKEDFDYVSIREEAEGIKSRINNIGPVNLLALEEYEKARDRLDFLEKQRTDLTDSRDSLKKAITKINKTASEKFLSTFELARHNFKRVFRQLFDGGEADLIIEDTANPLESPIEIMANPRGKKIRSLAQLSGGERALTAIALLFGIYFVKPSPFCILDEIDAPLDDNNLQRFLKLLRQFSENTQFIIITHNKLSMQASDTIYGVTMEKAGVTKLVSVRFEEVKKKDYAATETGD